MPAKSAQDTILIKTFKVLIHIYTHHCKMLYIWGWFKDEIVVTLTENLTFTPDNASSQLFDNLWLFIDCSFLGPTDNIHLEALLEIKRHHCTSDMNSAHRSTAPRNVRGDRTTSSPLQTSGLRVSLSTLDTAVLGPAHYALVTSPVATNWTKVPSRHTGNWDLSSVVLGYIRTVYWVLQQRLKREGKETESGILGDREKSFLV